MPLRSASGSLGTVQLVATRSWHLLVGGPARECDDAIRHSALRNPTHEAEQQCQAHVFREATQVGGAKRDRKDVIHEHQANDKSDYGDVEQSNEGFDGTYEIAGQLIEVY